MNNGHLIRSLDDVFNDPDASKLLSSKPKVKTMSYDPLVEGFKEIIAWVNEHDGNEPQKLRDPAQIKQRSLASRLKGIREDPERREILKPYDTLGLLEDNKEVSNLENTVKKEKKDFSSLDDVLNDDSILFKETDHQVTDSKIFDTKKLKKIQRERENSPEVVSQRKAMKNFAKYQVLFKKVQSEIASGKRELVPFKNYEILPQHFYVLKGQLLYIDEIGDEVALNDNSQRKTDARMHVIYENGTENNPTRNGLAASLYGRQGRIVTDIEKNSVSENVDYITGYVYVLESLSENTQIKSIEDDHPLYKVGFTSGSINTRIANAENESTYLYAPVKLVEEIKVINLNAEALETALHHALAEYRLDVDIKLGNGKVVEPREWFITSLDNIEQVVNQIIAKLQMAE